MTTKTEAETGIETGTGTGTAVAGTDRVTGTVVVIAAMMIGTATVTGTVNAIAVGRGAGTEDGTGKMTTTVNVVDETARGPDHVRETVIGETTDAIDALS